MQRHYKLFVIYNETRELLFPMTVFLKLVLSSKNTFVSSKGVRSQDEQVNM